jgi:Domain of unknown function (DUF2019)
MGDFKKEFIDSCTSLVQSSEDFDNEEVMAKHNIAIENKRKIVQTLKDNKSLDRKFINELLNYPHESVRIQAATVLLFEFYNEKTSALKTIKQIKNQSTNQLNVNHCNLILKKQEGYFYSKLLVFVTYITLLFIIFLGTYYNVIKKDHEGPMDLWAIILLSSILSSYLLIILISRIKKISLLDGTDKSNKFALPLVFLSKLSGYLRRFR